SPAPRAAPLPARRREPRPAGGALPSPRRPDAPARRRPQPHARRRLTPRAGDRPLLRRGAVAPRPARLHAPTRSSTPPRAVARAGGGWRARVGAGGGGPGRGLDPLREPHDPRIGIAPARLGMCRSHGEFTRLGLHEPALRLELQLDRLGCLTREPQLSATGVEA